MATGIREGRARFGDDVRERAREEMARRAAGVEATPVKPPVSTKPKPPAKPAPKAEPKAETPKAVPTPDSKEKSKEISKASPKAEPKASPKAEPKAEPKIEATPERKAGQFGPRTTFPRDVGTDVAAEARRKMFGDDKKEDSAKKAGGIREFFRELYADRSGKKSGGAVKKMASGGSVSKRADGCAIRGKTKGRIV
jgi:outer membrane biosynthesis protein TonB